MRIRLRRKNLNERMQDLRSSTSAWTDVNIATSVMLSQRLQVQVGSSAMSRLGAFIVGSEDIWDSAVEAIELSLVSLIALSRAMWFCRFRCTKKTSCELQVHLCRSIGPSGKLLWNCHILQGDGVILRT